MEHFARREPRDNTHLERLSEHPYIPEFCDLPLPVEPFIFIRAHTEPLFRLLK